MRVLTRSPISLIQDFTLSRSLISGQMAECRVVESRVFVYTFNKSESNVRRGEGDGASERGGERKPAEDDRDDAISAMRALAKSAWLHGQTKARLKLARPTRMFGITTGTKHIRAGARPPCRTYPSPPNTQRRTRLPRTMEARSIRHSTRIPRSR